MDMRIGKMPNTLKVEPISYNHAYELVNAFHYLGSKRFIGQHAFGLIADIQVIGAVVYSPLSVPNSATSAFGFERGNYPDLLEMSRLVLEPELNGKNYGSMLVGRSLRILKQRGIRAVISYADSSRHIGSIYQACNFGYYGLTPQKSDFYFEDGTKLSRGKSKGFVGQWQPRSRKHRYLYLLDKKLVPIWEKQPYPKLDEFEFEAGKVQNA
jgi:GNAT superfamily N-acetyltransferase